MLAARRAPSDRGIHALQCFLILSGLGSDNKACPYEYHLSRNFFLLTIGRVTTNPIANAEIVNTSWILLNPSLKTSNVPDGDTRVRNMSSPYAYTSDVDSSSAGLVMIFAVFVICGASISITQGASTEAALTSYLCDSILFGSSGRTGSYCMSSSSAS